MKIYKLLFLLLFIPSSFVSCIEDNLDDCFTNVNLLFEYPDFPDHIHSVTVGIYNEEGVVFYRKEVSKNSLLNYQGIHVLLPGGTYTAICWGNAGVNTSLDNMDKGCHVSEGKVCHPRAGTGGLITGNDALYYANQSFLVPEEGILEEIMPFKPAHIKMEVRVQGLANTTETTAVENYPYIRIRNLQPEYDFTMKPQGMPVSYHPEVSVNTTERMAVTRSNVLRFENENEIEVVVIENTATNKILHTVNLCQFMKENQIVIEDGKEVAISILITFDGDRVTVTMNDWGQIPTDPEM